jgi:hypothetical protein
MKRLQRRGGEGLGSHRAAALEHKVSGQRHAVL